jgi:mono/diheme cytochrome c family protein
MARSIWLPFACVTLLSVAPRLCAAEPDAAGIEFFERKVRPLLAENCFQCHGEEKQKNHLRLDSPGAIRTGGDGGPVIVPGKPQQSRLIIAVGYQDEDLKMPPKKQLSPRQVADLEEWVKLGAPMPPDTAAVAAPAVKKEFRISDQDRRHWAFQTLQRPAVPTVRDQKWAANPIDTFILSKLEARHLEPNPPASKRELIRRASYDLTGLPPSLEEVEAFLADNSADAWEKCVDRLLDSPRYGEKWGRHWLDLVRYAETNSYERDGDKPHAWRFRDYVIRALNSDKPYDRFIREQLAGDEFANPDADAIIATGFFRLGIWDDEPADRDLARYDGLDDIVTTTGQVFLGLTVDCARCHDHKLDPIPQKDYYRLLSFFQNVNHYRNGGPTDEVPFFSSEAEKIAFEKEQREREQKCDGLEAAIKRSQELFRAQYAKDETSEKPAKKDFDKWIEEEGARALGAEEFDRYQAFKKELQALRTNSPVVQKALAVTENGTTAPPTFVLLRGNPHAQGDPIEPAFLEVLQAPPPKVPVPAPGAKSTGRRTALANWIASPQNQLTARVMANRLWQYHFGRGIVRSPNNFGLHGDPPTHPELLDWLASELIAGGWRLKPLHRLIMTSSAYRMSSRVRAEALERDHANDLFWRFAMRRLTAEEIRDSILMHSGTLNLKMSGPSIFVDIPKEVTDGQSRPGDGWGHSPRDEQGRRSIYIKVKRSLITPLLESFDFAETDRSTPARFNTVQPTQALGMLNSDFLNQQATLLAARLRREAGDDVRQQVRLGLYLVTSRPPTEAEINRGAGLVEEFCAEHGLEPSLALKYFCLMALNLNEMVYLD